MFFFNQLKYQKNQKKIKFKNFYILTFKYLVGCSQTNDFQFLYENHENFQVFPTYSVVPCLLANNDAIINWPGFLIFIFKRNKIILLFFWYFSF